MDIFVFGSNREGRHGKGAASTAYRYHGAVYGQAEGLQGNSYAIITKELRRDQPVVTLKEVEESVRKFLHFAFVHSDITFRLTKIGCGLAGFTEDQIRPLFRFATHNVIQPDDWKELNEADFYREDRRICIDRRKGNRVHG